MVRLSSPVTRIVVSRVSALLLLAFAAGCDRSPVPSQAAVNADREPPSVEVPARVVTISPPQYRTRATLLETGGKVQFDEDRLIRVHAPASGRVVEVLAAPGDVVEPGRRLLVLDSPDLGAAKADYLKALSDAERSDKAFKLARDLYDVQAIALKDVRDAENDDRKAIAERERSAARLRTFGIGDDRLAEIVRRVDSGTRIDVVAPRSGVVVERNVTSGQIVSYGTSDTPLNLFVIADLAHVWVLADVYEPDIPRIKLGQPATVTPPCCPHDRYEGAVTYISDVVDKDTRTVKVRVVVPNRGRALKGEMFVRVAIATGSNRVLAIPQSAVHREEEQTYVLVAGRPGDYQRRPVTVGADMDGFIEVLSGVTPEDRVVTTGSILLKNAAK